LPALHAFPLINKMHAGREEKQQQLYLGEKGRARGEGGREGGKEEKTVLRQAIEYAWYTNKAKALDTPGEMHASAHLR